MAGVPAGFPQEAKERGINDVFVPDAKLDTSQVVDARNHVNHPATKPYRVQLQHNPPNPHRSHR